MYHVKLVCGRYPLRVLVCESALERLRGLLGRPEPAPGVALLIEPCWAVHTFGMRYPIDVVFCDARWRVLRVVPALPRRRLAWTRGAACVLELAAHSARPLGLIVGARLESEAPPHGARSAHRPSPPAQRPFLSAPVRALAGLAALTAIAVLLLGGCAAATPPRPCAGTDCSGPPAAQARRGPSAAPTAADPLAELKLQADIDYASRAWPLAEAGLRTLLAGEPRQATHWQRLGIVFLRTGRAGEAVESLGAASRLGARDRRTLQNLGLAHLRAAADALRDAAATDPAAGAPADASARPALLGTARAIEALLPPELRESRVDPRVDPRVESGIEARSAVRP